MHYVLYSFFTSFFGETLRLPTYCPLLCFPYKTLHLSPHFCFFLLFSTTSTILPHCLLESTNHYQHFLIYTWFLLWTFHLLFALTETYLLKAQAPTVFSSGHLFCSHRYTTEPKSDIYTFLFLFATFRSLFPKMSPLNHHIVSPTSVHFGWHQLAFSLFFFISPILI